MGILLLENIEFLAFHGCYEYEKMFASKFLVTIAIEFDTTIAEQTDILLDTIDSDTVHALIKQQMEISSNLIEHLARRILDSITETFPEIYKATLTLSKLRPFANFEAKKTTIQLNYTQES